MLRGFYTAASGMISQQRQQEVLANNIANANTPGYKADQTSLRAFPELLLKEMGVEGSLPTTQGRMQFPIQNPIGSINSGVYVQESTPNFRQSSLRETGLGTDLAIVNETMPDEAGFLFFTVQNDAGDVRYTRNGNFTVDGAGFLVTNQGYYVLDDLGNPIQTNGMEFTVSSEGMLHTPEQAVQLGLAYTGDANGMAKEGNDLFTGDAEQVAEGVTFSIHQGHLEQSNVDTLQTMTDMMNAYRMFETNQRVLRAYDESMGKAVSEIGRIG